MFRKLYPDKYADSIFEINYKTLYAENKRGLIFDIDNTLVPFDVPEPTELITDLFCRLKEMGFAICLLSNNDEARVSAFNKNINLHAVFKAAKPSSGGIKKALELLKTDKEHTVIIGDQIFTDVWGGKRSGLYTILVKPVATRDELTVRLKRGLEKIVINMYLEEQKKAGR